jgi:hypothetical protein
MHMVWCHVDALLQRSSYSLERGRYTRGGLG